MLLVQDHLNRRTFLRNSASSIGIAALGGLLSESALAVPPLQRIGGLPSTPHFKPKAKRIIYLFQSGAPSQYELFDPKPGLVNRRGEGLPDSVRKGQRLTEMTAGQGTFPVAPSKFGFQRYGKSGMELGEIIPNIGKLADKMCLIRSMHTDAINHDPAITFLQTGSQIAGRPSIGSWLTYGLGTLNADLPSYVVLTSKGSGRPEDQPLYDRLWGAAFLPTQFQGVKFRNAAERVLYLSNPEGVGRGTRRGMLDELAELNQGRKAIVGDPEIDARIAQYEMAFRMQASVPDLTDLSGESAKTLERYGPDVHRPGSFAQNCLLARRLCERGTRMVQCFHMGWDHHGGLPAAIQGQVRDTDQPTWALVKDLEERGLLEDTIVVWGGEFGRTVYSQGSLSVDEYGRDHHPRCFSTFMLGAGIKGGVTYGATDEYGYNITENPVSVHDLNATLLHLLGVTHTKLTYRYQGRDFRLTDVFGDVIKPILT